MNLTRLVLDLFCIPLHTTNIDDFMQSPLMTATAFSVLQVHFSPEVTHLVSRGYAIGTRRKI